VHGFTTSQVVADPRFRVVEALRNAGVVLGSAASRGYVQQVVAGLQLTVPPRPDSLTTQQLEANGARKRS